MDPKAERGRNSSSLKVTSRDIRSCCCCGFQSR